MSGDIQERLAANLRRLRIAHHLSQSELARVTAISKATLSGIEKGRSNPTIDTLASLARVLGVSIADLLEEADLGEVHIVRASQANPTPSGEVSNRRLETLAASGHETELYELALPARHIQEQPAQSAGSRVGVLVLHGKLIAGPVDRISKLTVGDYASFPADVAHVFEAGRTQARALVVVQHGGAQTARKRPRQDSNLRPSD